MSKRKLESLSTSNPKILKFFNDHESLDFDETILSFINIIEKLEDNVQNNPSNHSLQNILSEIKSIKSDISNHQKDSSQSFSQHFSEILYPFLKIHLMEPKYLIFS